MVNTYLFEVEKLKNHFYGWAAQLEQKTIFSETGDRFLATIVHFWAPNKIQNTKHDWIEKKTVEAKIDAKIGNTIYLKPVK